MQCQLGNYLYIYFLLLSVNKIRCVVDATYISFFFLLLLTSCMTIHLYGNIHNEWAQRHKQKKCVHSSLRVCFFSVIVERAVNDSHIMWIADEFIQMKFKRNHHIRCLMYANAKYLHFKLWQIAHIHIHFHDIQNLIFHLEYHLYEYTVNFLNLTHSELRLWVRCRLHCVRVFVCANYQQGIDMYDGNIVYFTFRYRYLYTHKLYFGFTIRKCNQ